MAARQSTSKRASRRDRRRYRASQGSTRRAHPEPGRRADRPDADPADSQREFLRDLIRSLNRIMSVVIVATHALEHQNADSDANVADILRTYAGNKLYIEIENAEAVLAKLDRARGTVERGASMQESAPVRRM